MLMSVPREPTAVFITVQIQTVHTRAIVALAIVSTVMDSLAMVQHQSIIILVSYSIPLFISPFDFIDIDECEENIDGCSQNCRNTPGSFRCDCDPGYELSNDSRTCRG